ncbi:hypothetical protein HY78_18730 [Rhizorhabdus wittichii DC-6]|nr:hypothetical protein HY78_18730 [Rhizorhabdus wittichii DC-6]
MRGGAERARRELRKLAWLASRTGWLSQVDPRKQPSIDKLTGEQGRAPTMSSAEIVGVMQAWAAVTKTR